MEEVPKEKLYKILINGNQEKGKTAFYEIIADKLKTTSYSEFENEVLAAEIYLKRHLKKGRKPILTKVCTEICAIMVFACSKISSDIIISDGNFDFKKDEFEDSTLKESENCPSEILMYGEDYAQDLAITDEKDEVSQVSISMENPLFLLENEKNFYILGSEFESHPHILNDFPENTEYIFENEALAEIYGIMSSFAKKERNLSESERFKVKKSRKSESKRKAKTLYPKKISSKKQINIEFLLSGNKKISFCESCAIKSAKLFSQNTGLSKKDTVFSSIAPYSPKWLFCSVISPITKGCSFICSFEENPEKSMQNSKCTVFLCEKSHAKKLLLRLIKTENQQKSKEGTEHKKIFSLYKKSKYNHIFSIFGKTKGAVRRFLNYKSLYYFGGKLKKIVFSGELNPIIENAFWNFGIYTISMICENKVSPLAFRYAGEQKGYWHTANGKNAELSKVQRGGFGNLLIYADNSENESVCEAEIENKTIKTSSCTFINSLFSDNSVSFAKIQDSPIETNLFGFPGGKGLIYISKRNNFASEL